MIGGLDQTIRSLVSSASAATVSQVWRVAVTFLTHIALRRMIPPEELGPWFWLEPFFLIFSLVRDLGVPAHMVRDESKPYGDFLRLQLTWGMVFAALVFTGAPLLARLYDDPAAPMVALIRWASVFFVVQGLGAVPLIYFEAELKVAKTIPAELARNLVFAVVSLSLAFQGFGVWSAVAGHIVASAVFSAMLWMAAWSDLRSGAFRLVWGASDLERLVRIGLPLMLLSALEQMVLKLDTLILALHFPSEVVGTAGLAVFAVFFFSRLLADSIGRALYPALVRFTTDPERQFEVFRAATIILASFAAPACFFLFINSRVVALVLGGEEWLGAADYLRYLSLVPLVRPLSMFGLELLLTRHMDRLLIFYTATNLVALGTLGLWLTSTSLGANGMAIAGYFPLGLLFLAWGIRRLSAAGFDQLMRQLAELYLVTAVLFLPIDLFVDSELWRIGLSCLSGLVVLGYAWRRFSAAISRLVRSRS